MRIIAPAARVQPALGPFSLALLLCAASTARAQEKIPVRSSDDLPRHTYKISGTASELLKSDAQFAAFARDVRAAVEADLAKYQIEDRSTLQRLHSALLNLDLLEGRYDAALPGIARMRELEDKEAKKLMTGLVAEAYIAARKLAGPTDAKWKATFQDALLEKLRSLPWNVVGDEIAQRKGQMEMLSESLVTGMIQSSVDPVVAKTNGDISGDVAQQLVNTRFLLQLILPLREEMLAAYKAVLDAHRTAKKDIWTERAATLTVAQKLTPVLVGIWDSGVDAQVFAKQLFENPAEKPNGRDDDGNGFVDDVHGVAFDVNADPTPDLLHPITELKHDAAEMNRHMKGFTDLTAALDSPEAAEVKQVMAGLKGDEVKTFVEDLSLFGNYIHGTHVAGLALDGNPYARLLIARLTFDYRMTPLRPTPEWIQKVAQMYQATVGYFQKHGVRVVNMSWGDDQNELETALEKNGVGETAEKRAELARAMYKVQRDGLFEALKSAPDILFIAAAGNSDNDVEFDEMIPSGFDLPNLLVVGAVDQAGEPTGFTSFGRTVQVYASGFEVESYVPGGQRLKLSGTSMASPNVTNLAAKLLALDPTLKPAPLIDLIKRGADRVEGKKPMLLINPQKTVAGLKK